RLSAQRNEISNAILFTGKAEDLLHSLNYKISTEEAVADLDPPHNGLYAKFIKGIRLMPPSVSPVSPRRELKHSMNTEESDAPAEKRPHL
ncbi:unnamed protein product, partial [Cyprideis torosa]